jgi:5-methylcytosine-specific restriction endonuclease McrA
MLEYCMGQLRYPREAAKKRLRAARIARRFPVIFDALAEHRLSLSAIVLLAPYLTQENAEELVGAASNQSIAEVERLLAERFPRTELLALVEAVPGCSPAAAACASSPAGAVPGSPGTLVPQGSTWTPVVRNGNGSRSGVEPIAAQRYALHVAVDQDTHDLLVRAQELLSHAVPSGDIAEVVKRGLELLVQRLEQRKLAKTDRPRRSRGSSSDPRSIPAPVRRAVWERDGVQCTYVCAETGQRCMARQLLELDHIVPVARGGQATVDNLRVRCRGHNGSAADREFGAAFMEAKRAEARRSRAAKPLAGSSPEPRRGKDGESCTGEMTREEALDVVCGVDRLMAEYRARGDYDRFQQRLAAAVEVYERGFDGPGAVPG